MNTDQYISPDKIKYYRVQGGRGWDMSKRRYGEKEVVSLRIRIKSTK
jgi:hypothetical protein